MTTAALEMGASQHSAEMLGLLSAMLAPRLGPSRRLRAVDHRPSRARSTFAIHELDVVIGDAELHRLILKMAGPRALLPAAPMAKPLFLHDPMREIEVYRHLLAPRPELGAPALVSTVVEPAAERYWLLMERISGTELHRVANLERWREAARWLARVHLELAPVAADPDSGATSRLLRYDADLLRMWMARALATVRYQDPCVPRHLRLGLERLAARYDEVVERLLAMPATVIHGELGGSNLLVVADTRPTRICALDWEMSGVGPALLDLAGLLAAERDPARRREVALAYRDAIGGFDDEQAFLRDLELCRVQIAIQWLGLSPDGAAERGDYGWLEEVVGGEGGGQASGWR